MKWPWQRKRRRASVIKPLLSRPGIRYWCWPEPDDWRRLPGGYKVPRDGVLSREYAIHVLRYFDIAIGGMRRFMYGRDLWNTEPEVVRR